jgi:nitric oxide reductase subunit B
MNETRRKMVISPLWLQLSVPTFLIGFSVLAYLAYAIYGQRPPIPERVVGEDGSSLFTHDDIIAGQHLFQEYGLMQFGTIFGHCAYLGPDFTAQYLHQASLAIRMFRGRNRGEKFAGGEETEELTRVVRL